jgi:ATP-binding cassette subfamily B protein/subfamily B ATP-binding cassette protein MsbA
VTVIGWTLSFLRPYRTRVLAIAILALVEIGLAALAPWPLKILVDSVLDDHPWPEPLVSLMASTADANAVALLVIVVVAGLVLQLAGELLRTIQTQLQVDTGQRIVYGLRARLLAHLQDLPLRHHLLTRTADSVYRLDADAHCVDDLVIGGVFPLTAAVLNLGVMFVILVYLDPALGLLSVAVVPALYLCLRYYSRTMIDRAGQVKALESTLIERAFEILSSVAAVKSFTRERHELTRYSQSGDEAMRARLNLTWQESLFSVAVTAVTLAGTALVLIVGGLHVLDGRLTVGALLVVIAYLAAVYNPISAIAHTTGSLQQAIVSARRVSEIFALTPETFDAPDTLDASAVAGHVRFESVSFSYDGSRQVLEEVSFEAHPGELIALVGMTGAGKTTIASLVPRFFEPTQGHVIVDDVDVTRYSLRSLRERIALVPQQPVLFSGTIADNIRYGRLQSSDQEVEAAARSAHLHDFVAQLPHGYQTPLAEDGATLSGGERQRLGIARALVKNAPILILDEPTSSLDALSEAAIFDSLRRLRRGRTTIVIAHRLSTIRHATRILVLHEGRVMAQGSHDALMASNVLYRRMCARLAVGLPLDEAGSIDDLEQTMP